MDPQNLFHTPVTYRLVRAEYLVGLAVAAVLALIHFGEIRWLAVHRAVRLHRRHRLSAGRHRPHAREDGLPAAPLLRALQHDAQPDHRSRRRRPVVPARRPEWALLALPLHLFGDRALFGNFYKSFGIEFEPEAHPDYAAVKPLLDHPRRVGCTVDPRRGRRRAHPSRLMRTTLESDADQLARRVPPSRAEPLRVPGSERRQRVLHRRRRRRRRALSRDRPPLLGAVRRPVRFRWTTGAFCGNGFCRPPEAMAAASSPCSCTPTRRSEPPWSGWTVNQFGTSYSIDLSDFTLQGKKFVKTRNMIARSRREGVTIAEAGVDH